MKMAPSVLSNHLLPCIYPSEPGVISVGGNNKAPGEMLTLALSISGDSLYNKKVKLYRRLKILEILFSLKC